MPHEPDQNKRGRDGQRRADVLLAGKRDEVEKRGQVKRAQNAEQVVDPVQRDPQAALQDPPAEKQDQICGDRQAQVNRHGLREAQPRLDHLLRVGR